MLQRWRGLPPVTFELIGAGELVKQLLSVKIGAAVDEDGSGRVKLPDQITAPVVVVEDSARRRVRLEKCNCAGREVFALSLRLALDYLGDMDSGKDRHGEDDHNVEQGAGCGLRTLCR